MYMKVNIAVEAHTKKRTYRKLQLAHMYVFYIIIEPVILSHRTIHFP